MNSPDWLTARPIAHRGLHDAEAGRLENTPAAVAAAIAEGYAIEVDLQQTRDNEALVYHDASLDRLTDQSGPVRARTLDELRTLRTRDGQPLWGLEDLLDMVAGQAPLIVEIKSFYAADGQKAFVEKLARRADAYTGPIALKSFDPEIVALLRRLAPRLPRGIVAEDTRHDPYWRRFSLMERFVLRHLLHWPRTRPDFVSYGFRSLPAPAAAWARRFKVPVITWTIRSEAERQQALRHANQVVFERFLPRGAV